MVAVVDTGIDYMHADLAGNMWHNPGEIPGNGADDDGNGYVDDYYGVNTPDSNGDPRDANVANGGRHGTHVAGTIGAVGNNGQGVAGVAWATQLMAVKVFQTNNPFAQTAWLVAGIDYARQKGASVINASWGGGAYDQSIRDAIERFQNAGGIFVNSAGNSNNDNDSSPAYPASYGLKSMLVVGASDSADQRSIWPEYGPSSSSHWGRWSVDVFAPGTDIQSTLPDGNFGIYDGTSMAAPHAAGTIALLKSQFPWENQSELIDRASVASYK